MVNPKLDPRSPIYDQVLKSFRHWSKGKLMHTPGMVGQTELHFPCKAAYAVAVFDHDRECFTIIRVMVGCNEWRVIDRNVTE